jgi:hypothetical protein
VQVIVGIEILRESPQNRSKMGGIVHEWLGATHAAMIV